MATPFGRMALLGLVSASLASCAEYLDRRDTLLLGAGEAVETNIVAHQIDPWPRHAADVYAPTNGERMQRAQERYRTSQGSVGSASYGGIPIGPANGTGSAATAIAPSIR